MKTSMSKNKGITLIALIITIIILLILAGVSISLVMGDSGIVTKAQSAVDATAKAQIQENVQLAYANATLEKYDSAEKQEIADAMKTELEKTYGEGKVIVEAQDKGYVVTVSGETYSVGNAENVSNGSTTNTSSNNTSSNNTLNNSTSNNNTSNEGAQETKYTVEFCNYDGTVLWTAAVKQGETAVYGATTPTRASDGTYNYTFNAWVTEKGGSTVADLTNIQANKKVYASYTSSRVCFVAGTKVLTENGLVNIEDIEVGMKVYSRNMETGNVELKEVTQTYINYVDKDITKVTTENGEIESTSKHPYYEVTKGWVSAEDLQVGDKLINSNGETVEVKSVETTLFSGNELNAVFNLEVEDNNNYFVGTDLVLVHNAPSVTTGVC